MLSQDAHNSQVIDNLQQSKHQEDSHMSSPPFPTSEPLLLGHMELIVSYRQNPSNRQPLTYVPFTFLLYRKPASSRAWSPQQALQGMGTSLPALLLPLGLGGVALFHGAASTPTVDKRFLKSHVVNILDFVGHAVCLNYSTMPLYRNNQPQKICKCVDMSTFQQKCICKSKQPDDRL